MSITVLGDKDIQRLLSDNTKVLMRLGSRRGKGSGGAEKGSVMGNFDC